MPTAHHPAEPSSKTPNRIIAPFVRRMGSAVRGAIAGGITFAARLRRSAAPPSGTDSAETPPRSAAPRQPRAPRRPRATPPVSPARPGWFARCFGPSRSGPAGFRRSRHPDTGNPFTPEAYANLPPDVRAILNTPVEDCDPVFVRLLFASLAQHITASLPPEAEMTEAQKLYSRLWGGLIAKLAEAGLDAPSDVPPAEAPSVEAAVAPAAPPAPPETPPAASADAPALTTIAAVPAAPDGTSLPASAFHRRHALFDVSQAFRQSWLALLRRRRWIFRSLGSLGRRSLAAGHSPPPRRLCYAACAGPP